MEPFQRVSTVNFERRLDTKGQMNDLFQVELGQYYSLAGLVKSENGKWYYIDSPIRQGSYQCCLTVQRPQLMGSRRRLRTLCLCGDSNPHFSQQCRSTPLSWRFTSSASLNSWEAKQVVSDKTKEAFRECKCLLLVNNTKESLIV